MHAAGKTNTRPASAAFLRRFELAVDPAGALTPEERSRRAEHACKAHMAALSLKASQARARKNAPAVEKPGAFEGGRRRVRADDPRAA
jgi:hypothetical protein